MSKPLVQVCTGKSCSERFASYILTRLQREYPSSTEAHIESCLCQGKCSEWPTVVINGEIISRMNPIKASEELKRRIISVKKSFTPK